MVKYRVADGRLIQKMTTIKEIIPMIDEGINFYNKYKGLILSFGSDIDVKNISTLIHTFGGFIRK